MLLAEAPEGVVGRAGALAITFVMDDHGEIMGPSIQGRKEE